MIQTTRERWASKKRATLLLLVLAVHGGAIAWMLGPSKKLPAPLAQPISIALLPASPAALAPAPVATPHIARPPLSRIPAAAKPLVAPALKPEPALTASSESTPHTAQAAPPPAAPSIPSSPNASPGDAVTPARFDANYLHNPAPPYPPLSRRLREEGKVVLHVSVTPQGMAASVDIRTSSGSERLDRVAQETVRKWKFIPSRLGDDAVQSWVLVPIQFKLEQ